MVHPAEAGCTKDLPRKSLLDYWSGICYRPDALLSAQLAVINTSLTALVRLMTACRL